MAIDQRLLKAAHAALQELPRRSRDVLQHLLVDGGSANTVADRNLVALERASEWVEDARQRFADKLELQLRRQAVPEDEIRSVVADPARVDAIAREAFALIAPTHHAPDDPLAGTMVGDYKLLARLGEGGMGVVYRAEHAKLGPAAVKLLRGEWVNDRRIVERLLLEAQAARKVPHPGVVTVYECSYDGDAPYVAMELLRGASLGARLRQRERLAIAEAVRIARQTASVLAAAHAAGVAHRDLKPDNIFLVEDSEVAGGERVKVLDFGLAKLVDRGAGDPRLTHAGDIMGSPAYMAPEQCAGARADTRADVYALGCTLFELVTGRPPFQGSIQHVMVAHMDQAPPAIRTLVPDAPPALEPLLGELLEKSPERRIAITDALQRLRALETELTGQRPSRTLDVPSPVARPSTEGSPVASGLSSPRHPGRRTRRWAAGGVALVAVIASAAIYRAWPADPAPPPQPQPIEDTRSSTEQADDRDGEQGGARDVRGGGEDPADPRSTPPDLDTILAATPEAAAARKAALERRATWERAKHRLAIAAATDPAALTEADDALLRGDRTRAIELYKRLDRSLGALVAKANAATTARAEATEALQRWKAASAGLGTPAQVGTAEQQLADAARRLRKGELDPAIASYTAARDALRAAIALAGRVVAARRDAQAELAAWRKATGRADDLAAAATDTRAADDAARAGRLADALAAYASAGDRYRADAKASADKLVADSTAAKQRAEAARQRYLGQHDGTDHLGLNLARTANDSFANAQALFAAGKHAEARPLFERVAKDFDAATGLLQAAKDSRRVRQQCLASCSSEHTRCRDRARDERDDCEARGTSQGVCRIRLEGDQFDCKLERDRCNAGC